METANPTSEADPPAAVDLTSEAGPSTDAAAATNTAEDDDAVVAEYDVFITPQLQQKLYVMQYMNRGPDQPFTKATGSKPEEVRIKESSGFIEIDAPLNIRQNYNRQKGVEWGEAIRKTKGFGQKAYGIAAGFERAMPRLTNRPGASGGVPAAPVNAAADDDNHDEYVANFEDANEKGHVLNTQTYGGQILQHDGKGPTYMVGTFLDNQLHLTHCDGIVQMRTQFHHLDATAQLEAANRRREKESQEGAKPAEPKAFLPTMKKIGDTPPELMQSFLKDSNKEKWSKLGYIDENSDEAYQSYTDRLFLDDTSTAPKLRSTTTNAHVLDVLKPPSRVKSPRSGKKKSSTAANNKDSNPIEISSDSEVDITDDDEPPSAPHPEVMIKAERED
ncbi:Sin-like protein conserved region-domain-containing protein [Massariosphaeria phaeospora]|uniref:Sin-like protein conserved region-domain-containing protein n=1 Tax=Massariosphaeria phaeospora TaxID=100035 RepID=A0A7C8IHY5_9PLEO|nr:Sin-like protein conserved region-domain-containing protein [Massariosphaeria phaeospora]